MNGNPNGTKTLVYMRGEKDLLVERQRLAELRRQFNGSGLKYWLSNAEKPQMNKVLEDGCFAGGEFQNDIRGNEIYFRPLKGWWPELLRKSPDFMPLIEKGAEESRDFGQ